MHLHRQHFSCIEEFQQQWKSLETSGQLSQQFLRKLLHQLSNGLPLQRSVGNLARMIVAVAEYPGFTDRARRQRRGEHIG